MFPTVCTNRLITLLTLTFRVRVYLIFGNLQYEFGLMVFCFCLFQIVQIHNSRKRDSWADQDWRYHQICKTSSRPRSPSFASSQQQQQQLQRRLIHLICLPSLPSECSKHFLDNRVKVSIIGSVHFKISILFTFFFFKRSPQL